MGGNAVNEGEVVQLLLDNGANVDTEGRHECTALVWAAHNKDLDLARFLLDRGASVDVFGEHKRSPLMFAFSEGAPVLELARELFRLSSDDTRRAVDDRGLSALDYFLDPCMPFDIWLDDVEPSSPRPRYRPRQEEPLFDSPAHDELVADLMALGLPVQADTMARVAARHEWLEPRLQARGMSMKACWRLDEAVVGLVLDSRRDRGEGAADRGARAAAGGAGI